MNSSTETEWPPPLKTENISVPGHCQFYDGLDGPPYENKFWCECGDEIHPDCDMSSVSIVQAQDDHRWEKYQEMNEGFDHEQED